MRGELRLHARPHPLHDRRVDMEIPAGLTLEQIFAIVQPNAIFRRGAVVYVDDWYIPEDKWHVVRPKPGRFVQICAAIPQNPGGGGGKKSPLRMVLMLAVVAASFALPTLFPLTAATPIIGSGVGALTFGGIVTGATSLLGMALVNALVPPQSPKLAEMSGRSLGGGTSPSLTITGIRNAENRYGPVPRVLGTWRWYPPLAARSYREVIGNEVYFRALFELGPGPMRLSQHRIGDRPIGELKDIQIETRGTPGQAAIFDGTDDSIDLGSDAKLSVTGELTMMAWVNPDPAFAANGPILSSIQGNAGAYPYHWSLVISGSSIIQQFNFGNSANPVYSSTAIAKGVWTPIAVVIKADGSYTFYVHGVADGAGTLAGARPAFAGNIATLGGVPALPLYFKGKLDDVELWSRALTSAEIAAKAQWKPITDTTGLIGRWEFDDGDARDYSGNQLNGTIQGGGLTYEEGQTFKDYPIGLFAHSASQKGYSVRLRKSDGERILETGPDADEIVIDISANGLVAYNELAQATERAVDIQIDYQLLGAGSWTTWGQGEASGSDIAAVEGFTTTVQTPIYSGNDRVGYSPEPVGYTVATTVTPARFRSVSTNFADKNIRPGDTIAVTGFAQAANNGQKTVQSVSEHELIVAGELVAEAPGAAVTITAQGRSTTIKAATPEPYTESVTIKPPARGKYRLRFQRLTDDSTSDTIRDELFITAINTITYKPPATLPGMCQVAMRVKATGEFNSELDQYNVLCQAMLQAHDGAAWQKPEVTSNPAWCALTVVRDQAMMDPVPDDNIDFASWVAFAQRNNAADQNNEPRFQFDGVVDTRRTVKELLTDILATARATLAFPDLKLGVTWDERQSTAVRMVTPRNSWGFKTQTVFTDLPHGIIVQFVNKERDYREDQVVAYADGYDEKTAVRFETMQQWGVVRRSQAWREGRYRYANGKLRPRIYELNMDAEGMLLDRNSLADVAHDVPRFGLNWGQVVSVVKNASGQAVGLMVDELVTTEAGKSYAMRIRRPGGVNLYVNLLTPNGTVESQSLTPAQPIPAADSPEPGDHFLFGEVGRESARLLVQSIRRGPNRTATIRWVDEAPAVHDADLGDIPAYDPGQNFGPTARAGAPAKPIIVSVVSDETAIVKLQDGTQQLRIVISLTYQSGQYAPSAGLEVVYRPKDSNAAWTTRSFPADTRTIALDQVEEGVEYEAQLWTRSLTYPGRTSERTYLLSHKVVGRTTRPPDVPAVSLTNAGLWWSYPDQPNEFWGFRVRYKLGATRDPAGAIPAHPDDAVIAAPPFAIGHLPSGTLSIFVWAVDTSGNESAVPAVMMRGLSGPARGNIYVTVDYRALAWPGTLSGGAADGGDLAASADAGAWVPADDNAPFVPLSDSAAFVPEDGAGNWAEMAYTATLDVDAAWLPAQLTLDYEVEGHAQLEYQTDSDDIFVPADDDAPFVPADDGAPFIPAMMDFQPWPGGLPLRPQIYNLRVRTAAGGARGRLTGLSAVVDVDDVEETVTDVALAPGGTRLPIQKAYKKIVTVGDIAIVGAGSALTVKILDLDADNGPLLAAYDAGGGSVAATINATIQGY